MATSKSKKRLDQVNVSKAEKVITDKKDLMYKYPKTATTLLERKQFRTSVRRNMRRFESEIAQFKKAHDRTNRERVEKELEVYSDKVLVK